MHQGERLKQIFEKLFTMNVGINSMAQVAEACGVSRMTPYNWEVTKKFGQAQLRKLNFLSEYGFNLRYLTDQNAKMMMTDEISVEQTALIRQLISEQEKQAERLELFFKELEKNTKLNESIFNLMEQLLKIELSNPDPS